MRKPLTLTAGLAAIRWDHQVPAALARGRRSRPEGDRADRDKRTGQPRPGCSPAVQRKFATKDHHGSAWRALFASRLRGLIVPMPAVKGHKNQVDVANAVQLGVRVQPDRREKAKRIAAALGISLNAYVDALLDQEQVDEQGRPAWWDRPVPADQEELPLTQTA